jgi:hypothetical protein
MSKKLGSILVLIVAGALMLYSASRTMHMLSATLPAGQEILAVIALAAFDLGLIAWLIIFLRGAAGGLQRGIALLMIVVDLLGVIVGFLGDTLMTSGDVGLLERMSMGDKQTIIMLTAFVIAVNIAGAVFYHMADPDNLRRMTEEAAKDKITGQALRAIETQASILANELAPQIAEDWVNQMRADFTAALTLHQRNRTVVLPPIAAAPPPSPIRAMFSRQPPPVQPSAPQTMAADGATAPKVTTEEWRLNNARENLDQAQRAAANAPSPYTANGDVFMAYDPAAQYSQTVAQNNLTTARAAYNTAQAAYNATQVQAAPKKGKAK